MIWWTIAAAVSGTGAVTFAKPSLAATGAETFTGTGGATFDGPALSGTGAVTGGAVSTGGGGRRRRQNAIFFRPFVPEPVPQVVITGSGGAAIRGPSLAGTGNVNDDELAFELLAA